MNPPHSIFHFELYILYSFPGAPCGACTVNNISTVFTKQREKLNSIWRHWLRRQIAVVFDWIRLREFCRNKGGNRWCCGQKATQIYFSDRPYQCFSFSFCVWLYIFTIINQAHVSVALSNYSLPQWLGQVSSLQDQYFYFITFYCENTSALIFFKYCHSVLSHRPINIFLARTIQHRAVQPLLL